MKKILVVEDQPELLQNNRRFFQQNGYAVLVAENLMQAREHIDKNAPDAIVLDIMLPDGTGLELLKEIRAKGNSIPVLLLTAWGRSTDITKGLRMGANDYLSKPFDYEVLLARVETMFRNAGNLTERVSYGTISIDVLSAQAYLRGENMLLTQKECSLLLLFVRNPERAMNAELLYEKIWAREMLADDSSVKNAVSRLRKKLHGSGYTVTAERGEGYVFERV